MTTNPNVPYSNESSKDDRLEALRNDVRQHQPMPTQGQTYLSRAIADAGSELGRFRHLTEVSIVGARGPQPTTYAQMAKEREQQLVLDQSADGHSALALERQRGRIPVYPVHPAHPFAVDAPTEPPLGIDIGAVKDTSKINP
jgi:hypothetical protein